MTYGDMATLPAYNGVQSAVTKRLSGVLKSGFSSPYREKPSKIFVCLKLFWKAYKQLIFKNDSL